MDSKPNYQHMETDSHYLGDYKYKDVLYDLYLHHGPESSQPAVVVARNGNGPWDYAAGMFFGLKAMVQNEQTPLSEAILRAEKKNLIALTTYLVGESFSKFLEAEEEFRRAQDLERSGGSISEPDGKVFVFESIDDALKYCDGDMLREIKAFAPEDAVRLYDFARHCEPSQKFKSEIQGLDELALG